MDEEKELQEEGRGEREVEVVVGVGEEGREEREGGGNVISTTTTTNNNNSSNSNMGIIGKHRMAAAIQNLDQQINFIQQELDQLDSLGNSSIVCKQLITSVESIPDPLLPMTKGPVDVGWERWFQATQSSRNRKRWI